MANSRKANNKGYVLYGFNLGNDEETAYFGENNDLVPDLLDARVFRAKPKKGQIGFGTPLQWLEMINSDPDLNKNFKFHLVPVNF